MTEDTGAHAHEHTFEEIDQETVGPEHLTLDDLREVPVRVTADLGTCRMLVRDVLELKRGSVVALDKLAGEMTDILANGLPLARGEVVVIGDTLHVRVGEVRGLANRGEDRGGDE